MSAGSNITIGTGDREIFLGALERTAPTERAAFLQEACGEDRERRGRIETLLQEQAALGGFLEAPAWTGGRGSAPGSHETLAAVTEKAGDRIGPYKLLQQIGEGGCGVVYMAEQEKPVRRRVALKVIKLGMDTRSVIARFEAERQALAMMDHPNIARVFDAGATDAGRPYFVMELVRGTRITDYCNQNHLPTRERLQLFIQVCQAIQHAHQKGIIHRDIKPSNILVTLLDGVPSPRVIDFGIAKATEQRLTDKTLFTEFTSFIGTPAYMSPEQAEMSGLDIDTRSDIYALGVLLYEMLVGRTPFDPETLLRAGLDECRRTIREVEPLRPSTRLATMIATDQTETARQRLSDPARLVHLLRGDLDWIAMKCLEKDRTRRYAAAHDLAMDVQNYLDDEPVLARPPSNVYRLRKLLHRHRGAFTAAGAIAATLVIGAGISAWQAIRATRAEHKALASQKQETELRQQAEREKTSARLNEYVADINLAQQSLTAGNYGRAVQLLDKHRPPPGATDPDLRGFEWRHLWQVSRGDEHAALPDQAGAVQSLAVAPAGDLLAVGLRSWPRESLNIWNLRTRTLITNLARGSGSLAFFPDGRRLVSANSRAVQIWNTTTWKEERSLPDCSGPAALSADATRLATSSREGVRVWDTATWDEVRLIPGSWGPLAFSPDGKRLATEAGAGLVLWPLEGTGTERVLRDSTNLFSRPLPGADSTSRPGPRFRDDRVLAFSPDGNWVVAARNTLSERGVFVISIWDAKTGEEAASLPADAEHIEHGGTITSLAFAPDGRTLVSASLDRSIRIWDFEKRQPLATLQGHLSEVWAVAFTPDGQNIISGSKDGDVKLWPARPQRQEDVLTGVRHPLAVARDSRTLAALTRDGSAVVFLDWETGEQQQKFELEIRRGRFGPGPPGQGVALSGNLGTLAIAQDDGTVKLWDTTTRLATALKISDGPVEILALSPDGQTLITRGRNSTVYRWDLRSGTNALWRADVTRVQFSPDGRLLATSGRGGAMQLWDATTLRPLAELEAEEPLAVGFGGFIAAFSADGRLIALACQDDLIRLWDTASGQWLGICAGHKQSVRSIALAPDGKTLASSSDDGTLKLWNVATQQELLTIRQLGATLTGLMFSPDGRLLVGGSGAFSKTGGLRFLRAPSFKETDAAAAVPP